MQAYHAGGTMRTAVSVPSALGVVELVARGLGISVISSLREQDPG